MTIESIFCLLNLFFLYSNVFVPFNICIAYQKGFFTILFKYYTKLDKYIKLEDAIREGIIKMAPQSLQSLDREKFKKLLELAGEVA